MALKTQCILECSCRAHDVDGTWYLRAQAQAVWKTIHAAIIRTEAGAAAWATAQQRHWRHRRVAPHTDLRGGRQLCLNTENQ